MNRSVYAVATMDTKGDELRFLADLLRAAGVEVRMVDVGVLAEPTIPADISREIVAAFHPDGAATVLACKDRGQAVEAMAQALRLFLANEQSHDRVAGVIGLGGSGGTALITEALRALPIGLPKIMVSTVASGNVAAYVGGSDIAMLYSVVDIAGLNAVSCRILANAAHAMAGMVKQPAMTAVLKPAIGLTMFGVTTSCVSAVRKILEADGFECFVFHATGSGGRAMEKLVASGMLVGILDITTTEVADEIVGGVFAAGPERFDITLKLGLPCVMSLGALDMVNFGAMDTVPEQFRTRRLHVHNSQVTLMRTTPQDNRECARWIATKLKKATSAVTVLIPERGVSALDAPGQPFHDPTADAALFEELESQVAGQPLIRIRRIPYHINDEPFAAALVEAFREAWQARK